MTRGGAGGARLDAAELPSLIGARFPAAAAVFVFHIYAQGAFAPRDGGEFDHRLLSHAPAWLAFFFILSGFVLTWRAEPGMPIRAIWRRRLVRIFPNHLVTWLLVATALIFVGYSAVSAKTVLPGLLLVQAWIPQREVHFAINMPAWSLSCEAAFYLAFPFLLRMVLRIRESQLWKVAACLIAGIMAVPLVALLLPVGIQHWFVWIFPGSRALEFILGMVLAQLVRSGRWVDIGLWPSILLLGVAGVFYPYLPIPIGFALGVVLPTSAVIAAAAHADLNGTSSPWRSRLMLWLGELAFAFYLVHLLAIRAVDRLSDQHGWPAWQRAGLVAAMFAAALAAAWVLNRCVERPAVRALSTRPSAGRPTSVLSPSLYISNKEDVQHELSVTANRPEIFDRGGHDPWSSGRPSSRS